MFLTSLKLNLFECRKNRIYDEYSIHKLVYSMFPRNENTEREFLFLDKGTIKNERFILILSKNKPISVLGEMKTKIIPIDFFNFQTYKFKIKVNPVKKDNKTQKLIPLISESQVENWFKEKAKNSGFEVLDLSLTKEDPMIFTKKQQRCVLNSFSILGFLKVSEKEKFIETFLSGVGKGKAFGFGLLQLIPN